MITLKGKKITLKLEVVKQIEVSPSRDSFITLKDHKPDFIDTVFIRLSAQPRISAHPEGRNI